MKNSCCVVMGLLLVAAQAQAGQSGVDLLVKMNNALHHMNYSGTLVHIKGEDLNTLKIEHRVENGVEQEQVVSLNKEGKQISRRERQTFSLSGIEQSIGMMKKVYSIDVGATKTVADRTCQVVIARPKDRKRYLQKYCLDTDSGLPLSYSLINNKRRSVERFTFTNVKVSVSEADNAADTAGAVMPPQMPMPEGEELGMGDKWHFTSLPKGFQFGSAPVSQEAEMHRGADTEHFLLTDGLSSVSVFISPNISDDMENPALISSGALNVLTYQKSQHNVTLVGELPKATLQEMFNNLRYGSE